MPLAIKWSRWRRNDTFSDSRMIETRIPRFLIIRFQYLTHACCPYGAANLYLTFKIVVMFTRLLQNSKPLRNHSKPLRNHSIPSREQKPSRRGAAAVECALCLLILLPIIFGTLEVCAGLLVRQSLTVSAFEGVRAGVSRGTTNADILVRTAQVLEFRDIDLGEASTTEFAQPGAEHGIFLITRDELPIDQLDALDPITVRIVAPAANNATPIFRHLINRNIEARATMVREFDSPAEVIVN